MGSDGNRLSGPDLRERIERLAREREPLYARADVTIEADERRVGITVDRVVRILTPYLRRGTRSLIEPAAIAATLCISIG